MNTGWRNCPTLETTARFDSESILSDQLLYLYKGRILRRNHHLISLIGLVFQGGLGIPLYSGELFKHDVAKSSLIYGLSTAITNFAAGVIEEGKGRSELISGTHRLIVYDPFIDLKSSVPEVDQYVLMALQDLYDNLEIAFSKLTEIHNDILLPMGLDKPNAALGFTISHAAQDKIREIALRTQVFPADHSNDVLRIFRKAIDDTRLPDIAIVALVLADIDGGILVKHFARNLVEDPAFTELLLSNMVAENPADAISVWIERSASSGMAISFLPSVPPRGVMEVFAMLHVGRVPSDFRLLVRALVVGSHERLRELLRGNAEAIFRIISQ